MNKDKDDKQNSRQQIIDILTSFEKQDIIQALKYDDIEIWPIIKEIGFYLAINKSDYDENKQRKSTFFQNIKKKLVLIFKSIFTFFNISFHLSNRDVIGFGAPTHRIKWNGYQVNRYFYPIFKSLDNRHINSILFEYYSLDGVEYDRTFDTIDLTKLLPLFSILESTNKTSINCFLEEKQVKNFISTYCKELNINREKFNKDLNRYLFEIYAWRKLIAWTLERVKPKIVLILCYYNTCGYALSLESRKRDIPCIDIQHGGQGKLHPMYNYAYAPKKGFNTTPTHYWVWNEQLGINLKKNGYRVFTGGNPWINFIKSEGDNKTKNNIRIHKDKSTILITLQPNVFILSKEIISAIKSTKLEFEWLVRFHPRMNPAEKEIIIKKFEKLGLTNFIDFDKANEETLPVLLRNSFVHITGFSGSTSEAQLMNVKTIIVDPLGLQFYEDLFEMGYVIDGTALDDYEIVELLNKLFHSKRKQYKENSDEEINVIPKTIDQLLNK